MKDNVPQYIAICGVEPVVKKTRLQIIIDWVITVAYILALICVFGYIMYLVVT
jgi:hypothetical protein